MTLARLTFRLQRSTIVFATIVCVGLAGAALWLAFDMRSILSRCDTPAATSACDVVFAFQSSHMSAVYLTQLGMNVAPFALGIVLGVPVVTREVEQRTALISWPLAGSRTRWLAWRVWPVFAVGLALVAVLAVASDQLARAYLPHIDIGFFEYQARGLPMAMRFALMAVAAIAMGAIVGRLLPSLLISIGVAVAISIGLQAALPGWVEPAEVVEEFDFSPGSMTTEIRYRLPGGRVISADEGEMLMEQAYQEAAGQEPDPASLPEMVRIGIAAERYGEVVVRETAVLGAAIVLVVALAVVIVRRRRPE